MKREMIDRRIVGLTDAQKEEIRRAFRNRKGEPVTMKTVTNALDFDPKKGHTDTARRIRRMAELKGGYVAVTLPEDEVIHDADNHMRERFRNGMSWDCDKTTGELTVMDKEGRPVETMHNPTVRDIERMQAKYGRM